MNTFFQNVHFFHKVCNLNIPEFSKGLSSHEHIPTLEPKPLPVQTATHPVAFCHDVRPALCAQVHTVPLHLNHLPGTWDEFELSPLGEGWEWDVVMPTSPLFLMMMAPWHFIPQVVTSPLALSSCFGPKYIG